MDTAEWCFTAIAIAFCCLALELMGQARSGATLNREMLERLKKKAE